MVFPRTNRWVWVALALAVGVALRLYFVLESPRISGDTLMYGDIAKNLIEHHVYGFTVAGGPPRATLIRVPGFPLFLAACFKVFGIERYQPILYVQIVFDLVSCLLVGDLARRLFGDRAGVLALWLAAVCPFTANYTAAVLTETLTLLCLVVAYYAMERWSGLGSGWNEWLWVVAAALAFAVLLRPEQGLLAAAVVAGMFWMAWSPSHSSREAAMNGAPGSSPLRFQRLMPVTTAAVCVVLPLVPWAVRNERVFHVFEPLAPRYATDPTERPPLGFQRWYRTWAIEFTSTENVYWNYDGADINIADLPNRAFDSQAEYDRVEQLLATYNTSDNATPELDREFNEVAQQRIDASPMRYYVALPVARLANMLLRPRAEGDDGLWPGVVEIPLLSRADDLCTLLCRLESGVLCSRRSWIVADARAGVFGGGVVDGGVCGAAMCLASNAGQFGAEIYAGVFSASLRVGWSGVWWAHGRDGCQSS